MSINIVYFASLKEQLGRSGDTLDLSDAMTAMDAWKQATGREELADNLLVAINHEYAAVTTLLNEGDEVAFFPPVTGG